MGKQYFENHILDDRLKNDVVHNTDLNNII